MRKLIVILLGCMLLAAGFWKVYSRRQFLNQATIVPGIITGYKSYQGDTNNGQFVTMYYTVATFEFNGIKAEAISDGASSIEPKIGKPCQVYVNPNHIEEARIYFKSDIFLGWVLMGGGLVAVLLGIIIPTSKWRIQDSWNN